MPVLKNRAKMSTSATGTGSPITLGSAESGFQSFADAGVSNGNVVRYVIEDGNNFEIGTGTYTASGTTLTRTVSESNNSNNAINLSGSATVFISAIDDDIVGGPRGADFDDDVRVRFGAGNDLQIYHDGTTNKSHITESGASHLIIQGQEIQFDNAAGTSLLNMSASQIEMFHSGSAKLTTETTGINVSGSVKVDNSTEIDDALISIKTSTGTVGAIRFYCESGNAHYTELKSAPHSAYSGNLSFQLPASDGSSGQFLKTDGSGNLSFAAAGGSSYNLIVENYTNGTAPSVTGNDSVGIGDNVTVSANDSYAMGHFATCAGSLSIALGLQANVTSGASQAVALGDNATVNAGTSGVAIGTSYVTGNDALAAAVGNNTSSYGAQGANSISIGYTTKATGSNSVSIGRNNSVTHNDSIAIGKNILSSATDQITLGNSGTAVRISEAYTLPQADGSNGQVLTTNGSGALSFAAAGGGTSLDLYAENYTSGTKPSASGNDAVSIGLNSSATNTNSIAIGNYASAGGNGAFAVAAGSAAGYRSVAIASSAYASATDSAAFGFQAQATSTYAVSLGRSAASGSSSFASAIDNNSSSYGGSSTNSIAIGKQARATATDTAAIGTFAYASGTKGLALGYGSTASGTISIAIGDSTAEAYLATSFGQYALSNSQGKYSYASGRFGSTEGSAQQGTYVLRADTTDATPEGLTTRNNGGVQSDNQVNLPNNSAYFFSGTCIAREQAADGTDVGAWEFKGAIRREANAGTTTLIKSTIDEFNVPTGWALALSADTTNGALAITITGAASTNIRWVATVQTSEVIYA